MSLQRSVMPKMANPAAISRIKNSAALKYGFIRVKSIRETEEVSTIVCEFGGGTMICKGLPGEKYV